MNIKLLISVFVPYYCQLLGSPEESDLGFLRSDNARRYIRQLPKFSKQSFSLKFPHVAAAAIDLVERMLVFDPCKRITGMEIIKQLLYHHIFFDFHLFLV